MTKRLQVLASIALKGLYLDLAPRFEKKSACTLATEWAGSEPVRQRVLAGERADVVFAPSGVMDALIAAGKIAGPRVDIASSGVGMAVRRDAPRPRIDSVDSFKRAVLEAKSVAYSRGPSGVYLADLFQRIGLAEALAPKLVLAQPGSFVGEIVARGEAEIGFQQMGELVHVGEGLDIVGPLPAEIQNITVFCGGVHTAAVEPELAQALLEFLTAPEAAAVIRAKGMEPA